MKGYDKKVGHLSGKQVFFDISNKSQRITEYYKEYTYSSIITVSSFYLPNLNVPENHYSVNSFPHNPNF